MCTEGHRTRIVAVFALAMRPNSYILCSAACDAVAHFLGVSSLNSGRSQGRPFFIIRPPGPRYFLACGKLPHGRCRQLCTPISLRDVSGMREPRLAISDATERFPESPLMRQVCVCYFKLLCVCYFKLCTS
jgi:hypothetical protein